MSSSGGSPKTTDGASAGSPAPRGTIPGKPVPTPPYSLDGQDAPTEVRNPYSWWGRPLRARRWRRIQDLHREYANIRVDVNEFEWRVLVPTLRERAEFLRSLFGDFKEICRDPDLPDFLEKPLRVALGPGFSGAAEVRRYLDQTERMVDTNYILPLDEIISAPPVSDVASLGRFLQKVHFVADSILRSKDVLFLLRFQKQMHVTNRSTGEVIVGPPEEFDMVLSYFRVSLDQIVRCAEATQASIKLWREQVDAAKKPFLEFLAASTNAATSRRTIAIQILAIVLALSFSTFFLTARDPFSLQKENSALRHRLSESSDHLTQANAELESLRRSLAGASPKQGSSTALSSTSSDGGRP